MAVHETAVDDCVDEKKVKAEENTLGMKETKIIM